MNSKKGSQFELFPGAASPSLPSARLSDLYQDLTLSLEHIIVFTIIFIMMLVVAFSVGVEKGKRLVLQNDTTPRVKEINIRLNDRDNTQQTRIIPRSTVSQDNSPSQITQDSKTLGDNPVQKNHQKNQQILEIPLEKKKILEQLYTIQVASFKTQKRAQQEADILKQKGFESLILPKGEHLIVCVGRFNEKTEAQRFSGKLKNKYNDFLIRRL